MHYILFLSLHGFYDRALPLSEKPRLIHRDKSVLDANDSALALGIEQGMSLGEAKALVHGGECVAWSKERFAVAAEAWYHSLLEYVDALEPLDQHQAAIDLSGHPDPITVAQAIIRSLECPLSAGLGASKWIAKAAATVPWSADFVVKPQIALRPLSVRGLPILPEEADRLEFLGYRTIGEIQKLDEQLLRAQFGSRGALIARSSRGGERDLVEPQFPEASVATRMQFADPIEDRAHLDLAFQEIAERMGTTLVERDLSGQEMSCTLLYESRSRVEVQRSFAKRMRTPLSILSALRLLVDPEPGLIELRVRIDRLSRGFARQSAFQRMTGAWDAPAMSDSLDRVRSTFGETAIQRASEIAEPRRKRVMRAWRDATGWM